MLSEVNNVRFKVLQSVHTWLNMTENWIYNQIKYFPNNLETTVLCRFKKNENDYPIKNLRYVRVRGAGVPIIRFIRPYVQRAIERAIVVKECPDIIHSHFGNIGWEDSKVLVKDNLKHVVTFYGWDINYLSKKDARWNDRYLELFEKVTCVLCEGPFMAKEVEKLGCPPKKINVHHLGVDIDSIVWKERKIKQDQPLKVLIAASFREKKGIPYALEALGIASKRGVPLKATVIGEGGNDERSVKERQRIYATASKHDLDDFVTFLGFQPYETLVDEAYKHHIFLSPSVVSSDGDTEGGAPVVLIDMAATGLPAISTKHCDIPMIIKHGQTGLLAEERDSTGLADHLEYLYSNPEMVTSMGLKARKLVDNQFRAVEQSRRLVELYQGMLY